MLTFSMKIKTLEGHFSHGYINGPAQIVMHDGWIIHTHFYKNSFHGIYVELNRFKRISCIKRYRDGAGK